MVLFGGLWGTQPGSTRRSEAEEPVVLRQYGSVMVDDQEAPSLTGDFNNNGDTNGNVVTLCALYVAIYIGIAIVAFSFCFEKWTIIDSVYFAISTFTTCGYGDLQPTTQAGQLFTIFFVVYGVIILGIFIAIVGHAISEAQAKAVKKLRKGNQDTLLATLFPEDSTVTLQSKAERESDALLQEGFLNDQMSIFDDVKQVVRAEFPEILVVAMAACVLGFREGWSFTSTMYFCIMSASECCPN
jgi:hypothetical protein